LIEECRAALDEELSAWDIDPPLHHVKQAHDRCIAWLEAHSKATQLPVQQLTEQQKLGVIRDFLTQHVQCNVDRMSIDDLHSAVDALAD
jgi:hypothetical protein